MEEMRMDAEVAVARAHNAYRNGRFNLSDLSEQQSNPALGVLLHLNEDAPFACVPQRLAGMGMSVAKVKAACLQQVRSGRGMVRTCPPCCGG